MRRRLAWICAGVALVVMACGGTAARAQWAGDTPGKRPAAEAGQSLVGDQYFRVGFVPSTGRDGRPRLTGYVYNDYEEPATNVKIQIERFDLLGQDEGATVKPLGEAIHGEARS